MKTTANAMRDKGIKITVKQSIQATTEVMVIAKLKLKAPAAALRTKALLSL